MTKSGVIDLCRRNLGINGFDFLPHVRRKDAKPQTTPEEVLQASKYALSGSLYPVRLLKLLLDYHIGNEFQRLQSNKKNGMVHRFIGKGHCIAS